MPVIKEKGPLPDDHPFKGTCIIFGINRPKPVEKSLPKGNPPDELKLQPGNTNEEGVQENLAKQLLTKESTMPNKENHGK